MYREEEKNRKSAIPYLYFGKTQFFATLLIVNSKKIKVHALLDLGI